MKYNDARKLRISEWVRKRRIARNAARNAKAARNRAHYERSIKAISDRATRLATLR